MTQDRIDFITAHVRACISTGKMPKRYSARFKDEERELFYKLYDELVAEVVKELENRIKVTEEKKKLPENLTLGGFGEANFKKIEIGMPIVEKIREWIRVRNIKPSTSGDKYSSYRLKHLAEDDLRFYVTNGEIIAAFILEGFKYSALGPNAILKLKRVSPLDRYESRCYEKYQKMKEEHLANQKSL